MQSPAQALAALLAAVAPAASQSLPLLAAAGHVLTEDVLSALPLPPFTQSAVDGYALRWQDLQIHAVLPLAGEVRAEGHRTLPQLPAGSAQRIFTGGLLPAGADTVLRQEHTRIQDGQLRATVAVAQGCDVRWQGEECAAGTMLASRGARLTPGLVAALAAGGVAQVTVAAAPRILLLVSGDEVVPAGTPLLPGQVPDANTPLLLATLADWGYAATAARVADTVEAVHAALADGFAHYDLVLTTGGVSVGDYDFIPQVAETLGARRLLWKVAQKPGMPLYAAQKGHCTLIGLPGNPASVLVNLWGYVRALLDAREGRDPARAWHPIPEEVGQWPRDAQKTLWLRAQSEWRDGHLRLARLGHQASHMLSNLAAADVLVALPPQSDPEPPRFCWLHR